MSDPENAFTLCDTCGTKLPARAPLGLCPRCMLQEATHSGDDRPEGGPGLDAFDGDFVENYSLVRVLGEGGFGMVYEAEQFAPVKRRVALKILKPGMDSRQIMARFEAERQALALLEHPYIATVYDAGETERGRPYFAMELVEGELLTDFCDAENLTLRHRLELFGRICQGVQHAHQKGVIHRDLKPGNILVERTGSSTRKGTSTTTLQPLPRIIDFGIARATEQLLTEATLLTNAAQILGTPGYMSPEQASMNAEAIDTRSDVYSLGAILYELLTGTLPFTREELKDAPFDEVLRRIREEDPPKPSTRVRSDSSRPERLPPDLDWITLKALRKDPSGRYNSVAEFAADIARFLNDEPVAARPPSAHYLARKFVARHKTATATIAAATLALLAGTIVSTVLFFRAEEQAGRAAQSERNEKETFSRSDFLGSEQLLRNGQPAQAVAQLVRAVRSNPDNRAAKFKLLSTLAYTDFIQPTLPPLPDDPNPYDIAVSGDDKFVVVAGQSGIARVRDLETGHLVRTIEHQAWVTSVTFHPADSDLLLTSSHDHTAAIWRISTGEKVREVHHTDWVVWASFLRGGERLVTHSADGTAGIWETSSGRRVATLRHGGEREGFVAAKTPDSRYLALSTGQSAQIWNLDTFERLGPNLDHQGQIFSLAIHPSGLVATGALDRTARVWDLKSGDAVTDPLVHPTGVYSVTFSPDGSQLLTTALRPDNSARIWDIDLQQVANSPLQHGESVYAGLFTADGMRVITAAATEDANDAAIQIWNAFTSEPASAPVYLQRGARVITTTHDGERLLTISRDGFLRVWDIRIRAAQPLDLFHSERIWHATFTPDSRQIGIWTRKGKAHLWEATSGDEIPASDETRRAAAAGWTGHNLAAGHTALGRHDLRASELLPARFQRGGLSSSAFTPDGRTVITGSNDGFVRQWDHDTGRELADAIDLGAPVTGVAVASDGSLIAAGSASGAVRWFSRFGERLGSVDATKSPVDVIALPHGKADTIASGHRDGSIRLITTADGSEATFQKHTGPIRSLAFSPDDAWLASGSSDNTAIVWNVEAKRLHHHLSGHIDRATFGLFVAFSPDSKMLVTTASHDNTTRAWDVASGRQISPSMQIASAAKDVSISVGGLIGVGDPGRVWDAATGEPVLPPLVLHTQLSSITFSPDERKLLTGGWNGHAKVWDLPPYQLELPEWFLRFAEAYVGFRYGPDGLPQSINPADSQTAREEVLARTGDDPLTRWAQWLATDPSPDKSISPWVTATRAEATERLSFHGRDSTLTKALFLTPAHPMSMATLAWLQAGSGKLTATQRTRADFYSQRAAELAPDNVEAWIWCARTQQRLGNQAKAFQAIDQGERLHLRTLQDKPEDATAWFAYGQVLTIGDSAFHGLECLAEAARTAKAGSPRGIFFQLAHGKAIAALSPGEQVLTSQPEDDPAKSLASTLLELRTLSLAGEEARAMAKAREFLAYEAGLSHAGEAVAHLHQSLATGFYHAGKLERALPHLRAAVLCYGSIKPSVPGTSAAEFLANLERELNLRGPEIEHLPLGSVWHYQDGLQEIDPGWNQPGTNTNHWSSGPAPLGYGNPAPATVLGFGEDPSAKPITTYHRHHFDLDEVDETQPMFAEFQFDDGIAVHVNGVEAFRRNLPDGSLTANTRALTTAEKERWHRAVIDPALLRTGSNLIAIEIHQANPDSSDIWMNFRLRSGLVELATEAQRLDLDELEAFLRWPSDLFARSRAMLAFRRGAFDEALRLVLAGLEETPKSPVLLNFRAILERQQKGGAVNDRIEEFHRLAVEHAAKLSPRAQRLFQHNQAQLKR